MTELHIEGFMTKLVFFQTHNFFYMIASSGGRRCLDLT